MTEVCVNELLLCKQGLALKAVHPHHCHMATYKTGILLQFAKLIPRKATVMLFIILQSHFLWDITGTDLLHTAVMLIWMMFLKHNILVI